MRVLVIAKDFPAPGEPQDGIFVLRQAQALIELGHELRVVRIVPHAPPWTAKWRRCRAVPARYTIGGITVESLRVFLPPRMVAMEYLPLQLDRSLARIIREFDADIVHAHFLIPCGQLAVRHSTPALVTAHGSDAYDWAWRRPGLSNAAIEAIRGARAVVAVSDFIARHVRALAERNVEVIFNGADERVFTPLGRFESRATLGIAPDRFVVAFAGYPSQAKGIFDLIEALARVGDLKPLLLVAGARLDSVERALRTHGVEARLCGVLEHGELARVLGASDAFALPSYREGLPVSICEAMLSGRPIVATEIGGIPEIVSDNVRGYLVKAGDVPALADRLRILAENPAHAIEMGPLRTVLRAPA